MKLMVPLLASLIVLTTPVQAEVWGRATWGACSGDGGTVEGTFSCEENTGSETIVFTAISDSALGGIAAAVVTLDLYTLPSCWYVIDTWGAPWPALPSYWYLGAGGCRSGALSAANDFSNAPWGDSPSCLDLWQGLGLSRPGLNLLVFVGPMTGSRISLSAAFALPYPTTAEMEPGLEYHVLRMMLSHAKSTGTDACPGCCEDIYLCASMELDGVEFRRPAVFSYPQWKGLVWEGTGAPCRVGSRSRSWGLIKTLYR